MAEDNDQESKTEEPSERKIRDTIEKGNLPFSKELSILASFLAILVFTVFVARDSDAVAGAMPETYREVRTAAVEPADGRMQLDIVVDAASIEVFAGGGRAALTMATFGTTGERGLQLEAVREEVSISAASLTPLRVAPVERE